LKDKGKRDQIQENLRQICGAVLRAESPAFREAEVEAAFYPYIGLTHTIRRKNDKWLIRISDHCRSAPRAVLEAIVTILVCKVMRKRPRRRAVRTYEAFRRDPLIADAVRARRLRKGRKAIGGDEGKYHSLREIYRDLNSRYFNNQVEIRAIGWGLRAGRSRLGHYDPVHHTITLSPVLDSPEVPQYVTSYVVYHELLHTMFEDTSRSGPKKHHPAAFCRAERAYPDYAEARKFLREFCRKRRGNMI
jgi:predicted metal-dependent hydrolase